MTTWTTPYHGVSHASLNGRQLTITDYGTFTTATVFGPSGAIMSAAIDAPDTFMNAKAAQMWCEGVASQFQNR